MNIKVSKTVDGFMNCSKDSAGFSLDKVFVQYGIEPGIDGMWEEIIKLDGANAKRYVDKLLERLSNNSKYNGFFDANQPVYIGCSGFGFKLNDYNLYYMFFNNLKGMAESEEGKQNKGSIVFNSIKQTLKDYFGGVLKNSNSERMMLTSIENNFEFPSICNQRNKGTAAITEMAAVAHNLWLLAGKESIFINSQDCKLDSLKDKTLENGSHAYNIVNTGKGYRLCDFVRGRYESLEVNPVDLIKEGKPITFGSEIYYGTDIKNTQDDAELSL